MLRPLIYLQMIICYFALILVTSMPPAKTTSIYTQPQLVGKWKVMAFTLNGILATSTTTYDFKYPLEQSFIGESTPFQWQLNNKQLVIHSDNESTTWDIITNTPNRLILENKATFSKMLLDRLPQKADPKLVMNKANRLTFPKILY